jgi:hypothetical protein
MRGCLLGRSWISLGGRFLEGLHVWMIVVYKYSRGDTSPEISKSLKKDVLFASKL